MALSTALAVFSYIVLYWLLIPSLHYERPLYFDYSASSTPTAIINLDEDYQWYLFDLPSDLTLQQQSNLRAHEMYDITINLHLPRKSSMHDIGNVMVKLSLYSCPDPESDGFSAHRLHDEDTRDRFEFVSSDKWQTHYGWKLLRKSSRPILLEYESSLIRFIRKLICFVPYCLGLWSEDLYLQIPIINGFYEDARSPSCAAIVQLSSPNFHTYDGSVYFDIQLQGIKYLLYHWFLTTSLLTISLFSALCCVTTSPCHLLCCHQVQNMRDCYDAHYELHDDHHLDHHLDHGQDLILDDPLNDLNDLNPPIVRNGNAMRIDTERQRVAAVAMRSDAVGSGSGSGVGSAPGPGPGNGDDSESSDDGKDEYLGTSAKGMAVQVQEGSNNISPFSSDTSSRCISEPPTLIDNGTDFGNGTSSQDIYANGINAVNGVNGLRRRRGARNNGD